MNETLRLADAGWLARGPLAEVLAALDRDGEEARIAGGAVRDALLGAAPGDMDIATTALPEEVIRRARAAGWKTAPTGVEHGTVTVVAEGEPFEVTTLRRDVSTDGRRATVAFTRDWAEDAARRDLTINGLYLDRSGVAHDHVGGLADLAARRVRFIGDARARIREDYLRILRFFRFHARFAEGPPDAAGLGASIAEKAGLARLSRERVRAELLKLLVAPRAVETVAVMADHDLVAPLTGAAPELRRFARLAALDAAAPDALLRLAALALEPHNGADRLQQALRLSKAEAKRLEALEPATPALAPDMGEGAARAALYALGPEAFRDRARMAWSAAGAPPDDAAWGALAALPERWTAPARPFAAKDFLARGETGGARLGRLMRAAEAAWVAAGFPTDPSTVAALLDRARAETD
ncbi:poly(A) polymerase [Methylopila jiangsuensis]|uniref:Poly(A) polymerase n=1 Tax=Methylopila jiangsuensis TaxID=586230 RepID=A0A9W6N3C3_9HYPH|nr:CCA tRNA nucleotidyltransferase [Methylopila jiangsuensis]MDR6286785.1 poly(A) polymerase [Methylopila jiangsuensis]GLK76869.1 poly(A) polymerase [Methylopila jiangsuensis]